MSLNEASGKATAKGIESLLGNEDKLAFQRLVDPSASTYRKKTFALGVQDAVVSRSAISLSPEARAALQAVRESLRRRLEELAGEESVSARGRHRPGFGHLSTRTVFAGSRASASV